MTRWSKEATELAVVKHEGKPGIEVDFKVYE